MKLIKTLSHVYSIQNLSSLTTLHTVTKPSYTLANVTLTVYDLNNFKLYVGYFQLRFPRVRFLYGNILLQLY